MIENALSSLGKMPDNKIEQKVKIPAVLIICIAVLAFILGFILGTAVGKASAKKKIKVCCNDHDGYDCECGYAD